MQQLLRTIEEFVYLGSHTLSGFLLCWGPALLPLVANHLTSGSITLDASHWLLSPLIPYSSPWIPSVWSTLFLLGQVILWRKAHRQAS